MNVHNRFCKVNRFVIMSNFFRRYVTVLLMQILQVSVLGFLIVWSKASFVTDTEVK